MRGGFILLQARRLYKGSSLEDPGGSVRAYMQWQPMQCQTNRTSYKDYAAEHMISLESSNGLEHDI
jgi:hypothetical protein